MLEFSGVTQAIDKLRKSKDVLRGKITAAKKELVLSIYDDLLKHTPQWSGNLASQWVIEVHGSKALYQPIPNYLPPDEFRAGGMPKKMGDSIDPSVRQAAISQINLIRWNSKVSIVNSAPYALEVEAGEGPEGRAIRDVNLYHGKVAMVGYITLKYKILRNLRRAI